MIAEQLSTTEMSSVINPLNKTDGMLSQSGKCSIVKYFAVLNGPKK
jgi:hypothetical protein